ncbi:CCGSCS motif protein [Photobacterium swingsii]|uniref:CCGSCS motif protein n=1 Tax=Photobacterium swingsii TaxID=680026 RepID=UPI003D152D6C
MALSFKKLFKKDDSEAKAVLKQQAPNNVEPTPTKETSEKKKGKHGEPGFCCGSCS